MPVVETRLNLKSVIGGSRIGGEGICFTVVGIDVILVCIVQAREARAPTSDVTDFDRGSFGDLLLNVEIPFTCVGRSQIMSCDENRERTGRHGRENGPGCGSVPRGCIKCERKDSLRTYWIRSDAGDGGEIRDHEILRDVIIKDAVASADHGVLEWAPSHGEARAKVIQIAFIRAAQAVRTDSHKLRVGG